MIPNYQQIHKGETLYSWLLRNAFHNCIPGNFQVSKFANDFLGENSSVYSHRLDYLTNLNSICNYLTAEYNFPTPDVVLESNTGFHIHSLAYKYGRNAFKAQYILNANTCGTLSAPKPFSEYHSLKYCSECVSNDNKIHGHPYFHTIHQLPGISICPFHNCILNEISVNQTDPNNDYEKYYHLLSNQLCCQPNTDSSELAYSRFLQKLFFFSFQLDKNDINSIIEMRLLQLEIHDDMPDAVLSSLPGVITYPCYSSRIKHGIHSYLSKINNNITEQLRLLAFLYDSDFSSFYVSAKQKEEERESLRSQILKHCEILSPFSSIIKVRCMTCGKVHYAHSYACSIGYSCPDCLRTQDPTQYVNHLLETIGDGHYSLALPFERFSSVQIHHDTCNTTRKTTITEVLFERTACSCERRLNINDIQKIISAKRNDMIVTGYTDSIGNNRRVRLKHIGTTGCDLEFSVSLNSFKLEPFCRCCENNRKGPKGVYRYSKIYYLKSVKQQAKNLVGDEYELLDYKGRHERFHVLHKRCGTVTELNGTAFWFGARCHLCTAIIKKDKLCEILDRCTGGTCHIEKINQGHLVINAGTSSINIASTYLLQELSRPTPSQIIPGIVERYVPIPSPQSVLYLEIKNWCSTHRIWDQRKSNFMSCNEDIGTHALCYLTQKQYIYSYDYNFYSIYSDITIEDMIKERFLLTDAGEINGIYAYDSLAFKLGLIPTPPKEYHVYSNTVFNRTPRTIQSMNHIVYQVPCHTKLTSANHIYLECAELIRWIYKNRQYIYIVADYIKSIGVKATNLEPFMNKYGKNINIVFEKVYKIIANSKNQPNTQKKSDV